MKCNVTAALPCFLMGPESTLRIRQFDTTKEFVQPLKDALDRNMQRLAEMDSPNWNVNGSENMMCAAVGAYGTVDHACLGPATKEHVKTCNREIEKTLRAWERAPMRMLQAYVRLAIRDSLQVAVKPLN